MSKLSTDKFSHQRAQALGDVLDGKPDLSSNLVLSAFLSDYFLCEALANKLIEYFEADVPPETALIFLFSWNILFVAVVS